MRLASSCLRYFAVSLLPIALTGCALTSTAPSSPEIVQGAALHGQVYGGQQPIVGARVFLFAANTTGYGMPSVSLLLNTAGTTLDNTMDATSGDYYVTTGSAGGFTITNDYHCTADTQVYVYAVGGNPGAGANSASGLMGVLGNCPAATNFLATVPFLSINEVTTIAAAYSFAGYATDALHVSSSGTTLAKTGIANAFANAGNLASIVTGNALATTPGSVGTPGTYTSNVGTVPQTEIYTLANILSACINSAGPSSSPCTTLLSNAMNGSTQPTDTATAAINIAHHPGANVSTLYNLQPTAPAFASALPSAPNDWTIALNFTADLGAGQVMFNGLAVDASGQVWVANVNSVIKLSPSGVALSGLYGYFVGGALSTPLAIAIDASGDAWVANNGGNTVSEFSPMGIALSGASGYAVGPGPRSIAFDGAGHPWIANSSTANSTLSSVSELDPSTGNNIGSSPFTGGGLNEPIGVAIDVAGNAWLANLGGYATQISSTGTVTGYSNPGTLLFIDPDGVAIDPSGNKWFEDYYGSSNYGFYLTELTGSGPGFVDNTYSAGPMGLFQYNGIAIDGSGDVWVTTYGSGSNPNYSTWVGEFSNAGTVISPVGGYHDVGSTCQDASGIAIDGSGDVWVSCGSPSIVMEYVGAATPVVTPLVANLMAPYNAPASLP